LEWLSIPAFPTAIQIWLSLLVACLVERSFPISPAVDPIAFFRFVCQRMANKVLPNEQQTQQHFISGILALLLLLGPSLTIIYLVRAFASYQWLLDIILLYLAMQYSGVNKSVSAIELALQKQKKQLARDQLKTLVLRSTAPLSSVGIAKACIEMATLRISHQQVSVMFWFICIGPVFALAYRLCYEASQSWNIKLPKFHRFGWMAAQICIILQWFPSRLYGMFLALLSLSMTSKILYKRLFSFNGMMQSNGGFLLSAAGLALNRNLSGAVIYDSQKYQRVKYLGKQEPQVDDIKKAQAANTKAFIAMFAIMLLISLLINKP
jgi:adenosylcobinamide-phosphate synthase